LSENALRTLGSAKRRFFHGPSDTNFDLALLKKIASAENIAALFRAEAFSLFNHPQFFDPDEVDGGVNSSTFR
jgi:hypothetical protein